MLPAEEEEEEVTSWEPRQIWPNDTSSIILLPCPVPLTSRARQLLSLEVERRHRWARQLRFGYEESPFKLFLANCDIASCRRLSESVRAEIATQRKNHPKMIHGEVA